MSNKHQLLFDIEVFKNYFMASFKSYQTGRRITFEMFNDSPIDRESLRQVLLTYQLISFNGIDYDVPMCMLALTGATNAELKAASDRIINEGMRSWQFEREFGIRIPRLDHIDLREPVPGVQISLKLYGARLHSKRLQELPYEHTDVIDQPKRENLLSYNENDLDTTGDLFRTATDPKDNIIATRVALSNEYGLDMRSKSDAQIAEAAIKIDVQRATGQAVQRAVVEPGTRYKYNAPHFICFQHPALREKFAEILAADFVIAPDGKVMMPACLEGASISIGKSVYAMGVGGLHSTEKSQGVIASPQVLLRDRDVVSFYPSLILKCGLFPRNMGVHFQHVYKSFFDRRIAAKKSGNKSVAQTLKIVLNGSFGKLGSQYSVLYSPDLLIQVTVTGQLVLLMMIERMEAAGIPVVSANTDGIVMACPAHLEPTMLAIVAQWERETGMETEETCYRALFSRDVNSYLALKEGGGVKTKGTLASPGVSKNPDNEIVSMAVCAQLDKGIPIAQTIIGCRDIRKFLRVKRVTGGAHMVNASRMVDDWVPYLGDTWVRQHWIDNALPYDRMAVNGKGKKNKRPDPVQVATDTSYLGKVVRWYRRTGETRAIHYVSNGNRVGGSEGAAPVMELPDEFPADLDHGFYIKEAHDLLREIGALQ